MPSLPKVPGEHSSQPSSTPLAPPGCSFTGGLSHREETAAAGFTSGWPKPQPKFRFANSVRLQLPACPSHSLGRLAAPLSVCEMAEQPMGWGAEGERGAGQPWTEGAEGGGLALLSGGLGGAGPGSATSPPPH